MVWGEAGDLVEIGVREILLHVGGEKKWEESDYSKIYTILITFWGEKECLPAVCGPGFWQGITGFMRNFNHSHKSSTDRNAGNSHKTYELISINE